MEEESVAYVHSDLTGRIINAALEVHSILGAGFLEVVYKDALEYEFQLRGMAYAREKMYDVRYKDIILQRKFYADFVVEDTVILEAKGKSAIADEDLARTINYLKCSGCKVGLILNFGTPRLGIKRVIY